MIENIENLKSRDAKEHHKRKEQEFSDSLSINSDSSDENYYKSKINNRKKSYHKRGPIKLCAKLTAKLLTTAYKSKTIKLKLDEDLLQRRIYFLTFIQSLEMIFSQYNETCKLLLDYPKVGGEDINIFLNRLL